MKTTTSGYWFRFHVNTATTWREKLGNLLRRVAWRIDGRWHVAIDIVTLPPLSPDQRAACVKHGLAAMQRAIEDELRAEVVESVMREDSPHLYQRD